MSIYNKKFKIADVDHDACKEYSANILNSYSLHKRANIAIIVLCALGIITALVKQMWWCAAIFACSIICSGAFIAYKHSSTFELLNRLYPMFHILDYRDILLGIELDIDEGIIFLHWKNLGESRKVMKYELRVVAEQNVDLPTVNLKEETLYLPRSSNN